jgi:hypothetical protein
MEGVEPNAAAPARDAKAQIDNALRALNQKKPIPEIDFTLHTMEDGNQVSTMERVCKGMALFLLPPQPLTATTTP